MPTKLTLRLDEELILNAKAYSKKSGKSLSRIVGDYFSLLTSSPGPDAGLPPVVLSLRGALRGCGVDVEDYERYLEEKHR